jgi:hypothetical protein
MNKLALTALAVTSLTFAACDMQSDPTDLPSGTYENNRESTNSRGTDTKTTATTDVTVDQYGRKKAVVETKTTQDPEGLFNKTTTSESKTIIRD